MQIELLITPSVPVQCHVKRNLALQARVQNTVTLLPRGDSVVNRVAKGRKSFLIVNISLIATDFSP